MQGTRCQCARLHEIVIVLFQASIVRREMQVRCILLVGFERMSPARNVRCGR